MPKMRLRLGLCPGAHWGSFQRFPRLLAGKEGARCTLPGNLTPTFGLNSASILDIRVSMRPSVLQFLATPTEGT